MRSKIYGVKKNIIKEIKKEMIFLFYIILNINVWEGVGNVVNCFEYVWSWYIVF